MRIPYPPALPAEDKDWPPMYQEAYLFDRMEVGNDRHINLGYSYMYSVRREIVLSNLLRFSPPTGKLLDLAGASGNFSIAAAQLGYDVTWNDLRSEMEDYVKNKAPSALNISYQAGNILQLGDSFLGKYDVVMALEVIEHVAHPDKFLSQLAKLIRPGGLLLVSTPNGDYFRNDLPRFSDHPNPSVFETDQFKPNSDGHIFLLYEDEMRRFGANCGLEVLHYEQFANFITCGHFKTRHMLKFLTPNSILKLENLSRNLPKRLSHSLMAGSLTVYRRP